MKSLTVQHRRELPEGCGRRRSQTPLSPIRRPGFAPSEVRPEKSVGAMYAPVAHAAGGVR